ncbi:MAG TPA: FapA family protein [Polyangia bacterium]|nr:FapA family protein [Polyangia bacterium]
MIARQIDGAGWVLKLLVDATGMAAHVQLEKSDPAAVCLPEDVVDFLGGCGLSITAEPPGGLAGLAQRIVLAASNEPVLVAEGRPLAPARRELAWRVGINPVRKIDETSSSVDLHEVKRYVNVSAGQVLCEIISSPAVPAYDVFGAAIVPEENLSRAPEAPLVKLGERVAPRADNDAVIIACEDGCVRYEKGVLSVQKVLEVRGDVDFKVGNIDFHGQVIVSGDVLAGFKINATADVIVKGMVENASIDAGGDIVITGGVAGRHGASHLKSGGQIKARYLHMVKVDCKKDLAVGVECIDSEITAGGSVLVTKGGIIGGVLHAGGTIRAAFIGSEMCVPTLIATGPGQKVVADRLLHPNVSFHIGLGAPYKTSVEKHGPVTVSADDAGAIHLGDAVPSRS